MRNMKLSLSSRLSGLPDLSILSGLATISLLLGLGACGASSSSSSSLPATASPCGKRLVSTIELRSSSGPAVGKTVKQYDGLGHLTSVENDVNGDGVPEQIERYQLDGEGRVIARELQEGPDEPGAQVKITYDSRGRKLRELGELEDIRFSYDASGRKVHEQRFRPGDDAAYEDHVTTSDAAGHPLLQEGYQPIGEIRKTWTYDKQGREVERDFVRDGELVVRTRTSYDAAGRRLGEEHTGAEGKVTSRDSWTYDANGEAATHRTELLESKGWNEERFSYTEPLRCPS